MWDSYFRQPIGIVCVTMVAVIETAMEVAALLDETHTYAWLVEGKEGKQHKRARKMQLSSSIEQRWRVKRKTDRETQHKRIKDITICPFWGFVRCIFVGLLVSSICSYVSHSPKWVRLMEKMLLLFVVHSCQFFFVSPFQWLPMSQPLCFDCFLWAYVCACVSHTWMSCFLLDELSHLRIEHDCSMSNKQTQPKIHDKPQ